MPTVRKRNLKTKDATSKRNKIEVAMEILEAERAENKSFARLDLYQLLNAMEKDAAPAGLSWRQIESRATLCQQLFGQANDKGVENRVRVACQKAAQAVAALKEQDSSAAEDPIQKIFFKKKATAVSTITPEKPVAAKKEQAKTPAATPKSSMNEDVVAKPPAAIVADLQKQQREQMEEAVAQMAAQMKDQTAQIHSKLRDQTDDLLEDMEEVAQKNVSDMTDVATATQEHVKASWRRTAATWTLFLTIVSVFLGTLVTIQMVPKSSGCMFFCEQKFCRFVNGRKECMGAAPVEKEAVVEEKVEIAPEPVVENETEVAAQEEESVELHFTLRDAVDMLFTGDVSQVATYLKARPDIVHEQDEHGWSLLHEAARFGDMQMVRLLLDNGSNPSLLTVTQASPLDLAVVEHGEGHPVVVFLREVAAAQECDLDKDGECLHAQVPQADEMRREALRAFDEQERKAQPEKIQVPKATDMREEALREYEEMKEAAEKSKIQSNTAHSTRTSIQNGDAATVPQAPDDDEDNAVFTGKPYSGKDFRRAAARGDWQRIHGYIESSTDLINQPDQNGLTALHLAVRGGFEDVVDLLVKSGADPHIAAANGKTAINVAVARFGDSSPMLDLLKGY